MPTASRIAVGSRVARTRKARGVATKTTTTITTRTSTTTWGREMEVRRRRGRGSEGREARSFFDPKRGQRGANFSGGTGLTRPPGILAGWSDAHRRRFRRETEGDTLIPPAAATTCSGPHLPGWLACLLPASTTARYRDSSQTINNKETPASVSSIKRATDDSRREEGEGKRGRCLTTSRSRRKGRV